MEMETDMTEQKRGRLRRMKFSSFSEDEYTHSVLDKPKKRLKECYEDFYYEGEENLKKTIGKRFRKTTFDACSDEEEDLEEDSGRRLSAISNISRSFIQERNFEIIERVFPSKKRRNNASFGSQDGKKSGFLGIVKDKIFQKINKLRRGTSESSHSSENNYVKQMRAILRRSQKYGSMTEKEKEQMAKLIFQNCGFPKAYRTKLWTLASGGERQRRNNIGYYTLKPYIEDEQKSSDENPEFKERRDSISDEDICRPLLDSYPDMPNLYQDQIVLDINRTFGDNEMINREEFLKKLLRILVSYSKRNSTVGYCQGMNFLAGMIVRVVHNEEQAFWIMCSLLENILPLDYFSLMTEVLVDQKVLVVLIQKKLKKLFNHLKANGVDFPLITFQWFVCLLSCTVEQEIAETIWDLIFLHGSSAIFWASLAILEIMSSELMKHTDFSEMYITMETRTKEVIKDPEMILKHYQKFMKIKPNLISKLREKYRPGIINQQKKVWLNNSRSVCPTDGDSSVLKRVKILNKFFFLNKAIRLNKNKDTNFDYDNADDRLSCNEIKCNINWPLCLYDFTIRTKICNFFIFRVSKPVRIIPDYFSDDLKLKKEERFSQLWTFIPFEEKHVTIFDTHSTRRHKRLESAQFYGEKEAEDDDKYYRITEDDQLLMAREVHPCVYDGFENYFHKMFDTEHNVLYMNWTVHTCYGLELENIQSIQTFAKEILAFKEIDALKSKKYKEESAKMLKNEYCNFSNYKMNEMLSQKQEKTEKYKRFGSFNFQSDGVEKQIWESALEVASQSLYMSAESSDISSDSEVEK
ncbi:unnamed protein product [Moneuplotes crassus]|uniref:Rab-GAP TBC domain-containing protein n=1 Tax=Euplotes crassus TaxID=5936 RepID=A0AAD1XZC7_EUPCR|nr:unnamed protein product [Moneuplotes crassus]